MSEPTATEPLAIAPGAAATEPPLAVAGVRWARPTDRLDEVVAFYRDGLGLPVLTSFSGHDGYDGVILGVPDAGCQIELTAHEAGSPCPAPTTDNLLVLYMADREAQQGLVDRMRARGHDAVAPENPYWERDAVTFADPDGWRVTVALVPTPAHKPDPELVAPAHHEEA